MTIDDIFIKKNKEFLKAEIVVATVVTDNISAEPIVINLQQFEDIDDKTKLEIGPSGVSIYRNPQEGTIPRFIDYRILVFESDKETRTAGQMIQDIQNDNEYKNVKKTLTTAISASNPSIGMAIEVANLVVSIIARVLKANKDDQLIYIAGSFDNAFDDLGTVYGQVTHENDKAKVRYQVKAV